MPEPVVVALIAAVGGVVGGIVAGVLRPWGQDYVNRKAEDRSVVRRQRDLADERAGAEKAARKDRLEEMARALTGFAVKGLQASSTMQRYRETFPSALAIGDEALIAAVELMHRSSWGSPDWYRGRDNAVRRVGELLKQL